MNEVTEADVLAGYKLLELELRNGERVEVIVKGLPWREYLRASFLPLVEANMTMITGGLSDGFNHDKFLDTVAPESLALVGVAVSHLSAGLGALKKRVQAGLANQAPLTNQVDPSSNDSSTPSASSSKQAIAEPMPGPQPS